MEEKYRSVGVDKTNCDYFQMFSVLYGIARDSNVEVVCGKLLHQLQTTSDKFWKSEIVTMITDLVARSVKKSVHFSSLEIMANFSLIFSKVFCNNFYICSRLTKSMVMYLVAVKGVVCSFTNDK